MTIQKKNTNEIVMSFSFVVFADNTFVSRYLKTTIDNYNITEKSNSNKLDVKRF